jgi:polyisoprenyl-teichoic acid--peptidoglycan teichoic acid transferase
MRRVRAALVPALVILALLILISGVGLWTGIHNLAPRTSLGDLLGISNRGTDSVDWKVAHHQPITLLLLARGGAGNDNPDLTDTIMLMSVRPGSRRAVMVSLPRAALVPIPALTTGDVSGKLYSAYALGVHQDNTSLRRDWRSPTGAGDLAAATVARLAGTKVDYWMVIDTEGFRTLIDAMGGVRVTIPFALDDPAFPVDDTGRVTHVKIAAGDQVLNGDRALAYARSRLSTSEADRSSRQQLILTATLSGLRGVASSPRLIPLIGALQGHLLTNVGVSDARRLAALMASLDRANMRRVVVDESNFMRVQPVPGGDEILVPRSGDYTALREYLAATLRDSS